MAGGGGDANSALPEVDAILQKALSCFAMSDTVIKDEVIQHWRMQEKLLQTYRGFFLISQALVFTGGALIVSELSPNLYRSRYAFFALMALGGTLLFFWRRIVPARALDVSYFQMVLLKAEKEPVKSNILTTFKEWQKKTAAEKKELLAAHGLRGSVTRNVFEVYIPFVFVLLWLVLAVLIYL